MRKTLKLITVFFFLGIIVPVWFAAAPVGAADRLEKVNGSRDLYVRNCARCHGADGKGETKLGRDLAVPDLTSRAVKRKSRSRVMRVITGGDGEMPAFGKKLGKAEINSLVNYVRSL